MACEQDGGPLCAGCAPDGRCCHGTPLPDEDEFVILSAGTIHDGEVTWVINDSIPVDVDDFLPDLQEEPLDVPF